MLLEEMQVASYQIKQNKNTWIHETVKKNKKPSSGAGPSFYRKL